MELLPNEILQIIFKKCIKERAILLQVHSSWNQILSPKETECLVEDSDACFAHKKQSLKEAAIRGHFRCFQFILDTYPYQETKFICEYCGSSGSLECLQLAREHGFFWGEVFYINAVTHGHFELLQWAYEHGCPLGSLETEKTYLPSIAADQGYLDILQWLVENEIGTIDDFTCAYASHGGHLSVLEWLQQRSETVWTEKCCAYAAEMNHLHVIQWLRNLVPPCPWDTSACAYAAQSGHLDMIRYLHEHGCPWDASVSFLSYEGKYREVYQYVVEQGCPLVKISPKDPVNTPMGDFPLVMRTNE